MAVSELGPVQLAGKLDQNGSWNGLPLWGSGGITESARAAHFAARLLTSAVFRRPPLVISTHVNFGPVAYALHQALGIPYVLVAHGIDVSPHMSATRLRALRAAEALWSVSRWTRDRLLACRVAAQKIQIIPNTVSEEVFGLGKPRGDLRTRYSIKENEKVILTVARLERGEGYKGCDKVLQALPAVRQAVGPLRYLIVGRGDDTARLRSLGMELGIERFVTFCGFVSDSELPDHYRMADVFAMPSSGEGFGVVFLEAMACGIPVLGGDRDGTTDALADGELGLLVDPDLIEAVAAGLINLLLRRGVAVWFTPERLRARCLDLYGRRAFRNRVREALVPFTAQLEPQGTDRL